MVQGFKSAVDHRSPARVREEDPGLLRVTVADKVDNARSILFDYEHMGEDLWRRFNAGKEEQGWFYKSSLQVYKDAHFQGPLLDALESLVNQIRAIIN